MDRLISLVILWLCATSAWAGYAYPTMPSGWSPTSVGPGLSTTVQNGFAYNSVSVTAAGRQIIMPAAARFAVNAPRFARFGLGLHPGWLLTTALAGWLAQKYLVQDQQTGAIQFDPVAAGQGTTYSQQYPAWFSLIVTNPNCTHTQLQLSMDALRAEFKSDWNVSPCRGTNTDLNVTGTGLNVTATWIPGGSSGTYTATTVCPSGGSVVNGQCLCPAGNVYVGDACVPDSINTGLREPTPQELESLDTVPLSDQSLDDLIDHMPMPVESPTLSPVDEPVGEPRLDPTTGKTVQDRVQVFPSPTASDPFRVEVTPYTKTIGNADGTPIPEGEQTAKQETDPCKLNPNSLMCAELGTAPGEEPINNQELPFSISPLSGFGPESGSCPAPHAFTVGGKAQIWEYTPVCNFMSAVRPVVIAMAWLTAIMLALGAARKE